MSRDGTGISCSRCSYVAENLADMLSHMASEHPGTVTREIEAP